ncbi:MAG: GH36-type glycosyl hydrolase domain-containing protein [Bacillota bacterium]
MKYGYFNDINKEYIITNPKTPVKWINYIGSLGFGGFIDQTGGILICKGDPAINRITKYIPQLPASSFNGETMYIRIRNSDAYTIFSPYFVPTLDQYNSYECHVGLGYSRIISETYGIKADITIFVPKGDHRVIRDIKITNLRSTEVELDLIPVVEYTHFDALKQLTNADWVPQTMQSRALRTPGGYLVITQYAFMNKESRVNFYTSSSPVSSFETDRGRFLGDNEYGTWESPLSLKNPELGCYEAERGNNICALMNHLGILQPGETKRVVIQLGQCESIEKEIESIAVFRNFSNVDEEFTRLRYSWESYLSAFSVETPDKALNTMMNIHNPRQCYITKNWSRYLSLYQLGFGARGIGFRDSSQDVMGIMTHAPKEGKELIEMLLKVQRLDGSAMHQFNPVTMIGNEGDSREHEDRPKYYGDDHLWIVLSVCSYIKETGDSSFLDKIIPFYDKDKNEKPIEEGSVMEHLHRAIEFTRSNLGKHGLPLLGFADWNDTVNLPAGSESLFNANLYGKALCEMIELLNFIGSKKKADIYEQYYKEMKETVNRHGWDGDWYIRYFDEKGKAIGSKSNKEGQIYLNAQSWAVLSGFASKERAEKAMDSAYRILNTRNGIKLSYPGYDGYNPQKGGITTYPPGAKENGGIFLHSNPWAMIAETMIGNGDRAFEYYNQINPVNKNEIIDEFECEPYCYPQNILGDEHPQFGLARNSWLSGTASWMFQACSKHILGIMPTYKGLTINPCIPSSWEGFSISRVFRNARYNITVKNPERLNCGVKTIKVDKEYIIGNVLPVFDGGIHEVEVIMG